MKYLAKELDIMINRILMKAENQHELLIGSCESHIKLTNTQEHILMLLSEERLTNTDLAKRLNVSQAAVTKAVKSLVEKGMLETVKAEDDGRVVQLILTGEGLPIAQEHAHHHEKTLSVYDDVLKEFSDEDKEVISTFIGRLSEKLEG